MIVLLLFAALACAALLLLLLLTRWPAVWYLSFSIRRIQMFEFGWNTHFDTDLSSNSCDVHNLVGFVV
jgi:hypothetical protein